MAAKEDALGLIHELTAQHLTDVLQKAREGEFELTAPLLAQINTFLKNNHVQCEVDDTPEMKALKAEGQQISQGKFNPSDVDDRWKATH